MFALVITCIYLLHILHRLFTYDSSFKDFSDNGLPSILVYISDFIIMSWIKVQCVFSFIRNPDFKRSLDLFCQSQPGFLFV